jgi:hypothetical protein
MISHVVETVEPVLSYARECLLRGGSDEAGNALQSCSMYLNLYRPPVYAECNVAACLRDRLHGYADERRVFNIEPTHGSIADTQQVLDCLAMLSQSVVLEEESMLIVEVFDDDQAPCIAFSLDGPGRFPEEFAFNGMLRISIEEIGARWTSATRGGRIETAPNGLLLRLTGQRMPPDATGQYEDLREAVDGAARLCEGGHEPGALPNAVDESLSVIDGECGKSPADLNALLEKTLEICKPELTKHSIVLEALPASGLPPIVVHRERLQGYIANLAVYALYALIDGGTMTVLLEYDPERRAVELAADFSGKKCRAGDKCTLASLRRTVENVHEGAFKIEERPQQTTLTAVLPDTVGLALDQWIPNFDVLSSKSQQVLRLLRSGGETPPEDLLLAGVLEDELERWLLPKLSDSPAANVAHEIAAGVKQQSSVAGRLGKALDQIKRGKPRREIAKPPYAPVLLRAFNASGRGRRAIGAEAITEAEIERLCIALESTPPDYAGCLRLIARARRGASHPSAGGL